MFATVVYSAFAGWQLYEIHSGATDTHTLAKAAQRQAENSTRQLDITDRPWVGIDGSIKVMNGSIHANPASANFGFTLKNVGRSMAFEVQTSIWVDAGAMKGLKLMASHHCEEMAESLRKNRALRQDFAQHKELYPGGIEPPHGFLLLPEANQSLIDVPQPGAPSHPDNNVYVLFCTVYSDQLRIVHLTQNTFCYTSRYAQLRDVPQVCGQGNYAY